MTDHQFLRINDDWALAYDSNQWILQKVKMQKGVQCWRPVSFVGSTKDILARVMREKGVPESDAQCALDRLPHRFDDFLKAVRDGEFSGGENASQGSGDRTPTEDSQGTESRQKLERAS